MFLHFGHFLRKGVFQGFLSAGWLSLCRMVIYICRNYISAESRKLQIPTTFCRNQPLSAEISLFLKKCMSFCPFRLSAKTFCLRCTCFRFRPWPLRLISRSLPNYGLITLCCEKVDTQSFWFGLSLVAKLSDLRWHIWSRFKVLC